MKKIRILVAEDTKEARDILVENLTDYELEKYGNNNVFEITKAESFVKASQLIKESGKNGTPYEVFFCDIDFTEDNKGGKRDSGFELIKLAFEISNITNIYTYSGQFKAADLWDGYEPLVSKGLVIKTFDKSHTEGGEMEWVKSNFDDLFNRLADEKILWDIWSNHELVKKSVATKVFSEDAMENLLAQNEIISNLDTILFLTKKLPDFDAEKVIYRLIIQLYHRSLESFCRGSKSDDEIYNDSMANKKKVEELTNQKKPWPFTEKITALQAILSFSADYYSKFGYKVNNYRNNSVHPNDNFDVSLSNVYYCGIALALYCSNGDKKGITIEEIKTKLKALPVSGRRDLEEILSIF